MGDFEIEEYERIGVLEFAKQTYGIKVLRYDDLNHPKLLKLSPGCELDEVKEKAFQLAFPGNGTAPESTTITSLDGFEIDDIGILQVVASCTIIVNPGLNFVDQQAVKDILEKETKKKEKEPKKNNTKSKRAKLIPKSIEKMFGGKVKELTPNQERVFEVQAQAIRSYAAERDDEIDFQKGDILLIDVSAIPEDGWIYGQLNGKVGLIPSTFIQLIGEQNDLLPPMLSTGISFENILDEEKKQKEQRNLIQVTCLHSFVANNEEELSFEKGTILNVDVEQISKKEEWCYAELEDQSGLVPLSYIRIGVIDLEEEEKKRERVWVYAEVLYSYIAQREDEMSINEGDLLMIEEIHTDPDWVISQMNGREGLVPAPYVQVISKDEVKKRVKMRSADLKYQRKIVEEEIRKKKIKDAEHNRQKKIRQIELEKKRKEAEIKRKIEEEETLKAEMVRQALHSRIKLYKSDSEDDD